MFKSLRKCDHLVKTFNIKKQPVNATPLETPWCGLEAADDYSVQCTPASSETIYSVGVFTSNPSILHPPQTDSAFDSINTWFPSKCDFVFQVLKVASSYPMEFNFVELSAGMSHDQAMHV